MFNHSATGNTATQEKVKNLFDTILRCCYEKISADNTIELQTSCRELWKLLEAHPYHPAIAALLREYFPYQVCALDFLSKQEERATAEASAINNRIQPLLELHDSLSTGWTQAHIPMDNKLPEAFLKRERPRLLATFQQIDNSWKQHAFQLPAAIALEAVLVLANTPGHHPVTYSLWAYGQRLQTHMQQLLNQPDPLTEEQIITTLLGLRCNTGQFTIWFTEHTKNAIQQADSMHEKKST